MRRERADESCADGAHRVRRHRCADLPHASHHIARQQRELQSHRALGSKLADTVRFRSTQFRQPDRLDWRAIFAFTQSPNGSFAFNFLISLKAEPELKFDYHKATYRNEGLGR